MIYWKDYLKESSKIEDETIDFILTDPPYGVGKEFANDKLSVREYKTWTDYWLNESYRILKPGKKLIFTYSQIGLFDMKRRIEKTLFQFIQLLVWYYGNITGGWTGLYIRNWEPIFVLSKGSPEKIHRIEGISTCDVLKYTKPQSNFRRDRRVHPTQKPYKLWERLVLEHTETGDMVLDPFAGCCQLEDIGRRWNRKTICYELDNSYRKNYLVGKEAGNNVGLFQ